jgi:hypothetical protein
LLTTAATGLAGCRSAAPPAAIGAAAIAPWEIPTEELGRQSLYRVQIRAAEERGSLRLILRLWKAGRFEVAASDALGRSLWSLRSADGAAVWSDGERGGPCAVVADRPIRWPRFGWTFPASDLPALLLGRLPEPPTEPIGTAAVGETVIKTGSGRHFRFTVAGGLPVRWSLLGDGPERTLSWTREDDGGRLESANGELEIRWRRVSREPVSGPPPAPPAGNLPECEIEDLR